LQKLRNYIFESRLQLPFALPLLQAAGRRLSETKNKTICFFEMPNKNERINSIKDYLPAFKSNRFWLDGPFNMIL
jgi:hypothetical protein